MKAAIGVEEAYFAFPVAARVPGGAGIVEKAMAGLIRWIREGRIGARDAPLFIHMGGLPGLFAYEQYFTQAAEKSPSDRRSTTEQDAY